jgi:hypothetical protein
MATPYPAQIQVIMDNLMHDNEDVPLKFIANIFEVEGEDAKRLLQEMKDYASGLKLGFTESTLEEIDTPIFADPASIYSPMSQFFAQYDLAIIKLQRSRSGGYFIEAGTPWRLETDRIQKVWRTVRI